MIGMSSDKTVYIPGSGPSEQPVSRSANMEISSEAAAVVDGSQDDGSARKEVRKVTKKIAKTKIPDSSEEEEEEPPLIDKTALLPKNSKKTRRLEKQHQASLLKASSRMNGLLLLPPELLHLILGHLRPSDIRQFSHINHAARSFVQRHETSLAKDIIARSYWVLSRCFPLPQPLHTVSAASQTALSHPRREKMTEVHKKPYQHISPPSNTLLCTCPSCLLAWNNLNVVLDLAHFQQGLDRRVPIPMIPRGQQPAWNTSLIQRHATTIERAMQSPLTYAAVLETHLSTIVGTLLRPTRPPPSRPQPVHRHNKTAAATPAKSQLEVLPYGIDKTDAESGDDVFLERAGKESYEFPWHRDVYYSVAAYVPNRKWSRVEGRWMYYAAGGHERDLEWLRRWFLPAVAD